MNEQLRFDGQVAIVTGAGTGLGRAHAEALASRGAAVVVNDIGMTRDGLEPDTNDAQAVVDAIVAGGGTAVANSDSVATVAGAEALVAAALDSYGRLDIVINNAGVTGAGAFGPPEVWERVVATHLYGTANVLRAAWPHFVERDYGRVVNTASSSFLGTPSSGDYAAAKGGIVGLSKVLASDNRDRNITINVLMPVAYTRMTAAVPDPVYAGWLERHFQPEKVAAFVLTLCHESTSVSGETFIAGGGRAARVLFQTTRGHFDPDPTPEAFRDHFDAVMAGEDARIATSGQGDLVRYVELLGDPGPFADNEPQGGGAGDAGEAGDAVDQPRRPYVFDVAAISGHTNADLLGGAENADELFELLGRDLVTKTLVQTPKLSVYHETAKPGERVKPHRHGTYQVNYVLRGELIFGNQRVTAGMGYFSPDMLYSWRAGEEGAEWIEIHSGIGGVYTDRPES